MADFNEATPVACLTVGQFKSLLIRPNDHETIPTNQYRGDANLIYGIKALSNFLNISEPTATNLIKSGRITYAKTGHKYIFDRVTVLSELGYNTKNL